MHAPSTGTRRRPPSGHPIHLAARWVLLGLLLLSPAVAAQTQPGVPAVAAPHRPVHLYRSDSRPPTEIFRDGFRSRGDSNIDLDAYINTGSNPTNEFRFISFTDDRNLNFFQNAMLAYYAAGEADRGPFVGYRYRIEANNFAYSTITSLEHAAAAYPRAEQQLTNTLMRYPHQREWVALDQVENHRVVDVEVLEHVRGSSPARFRVRERIPNPNYLPGSRAGANPGPFIFQPGQLTEPRYLGNSPGARRFSASFAMCFRSTRPKRAEGADCERDFGQTDAEGNNYFNTQTGRDQHGLTPWKTRKVTERNSVIEETSVCKIFVFPGTDDILIRCPNGPLPLYTPIKFDVLISAGGKVNTYVDTRISSDQIRHRISEEDYVYYWIHAKDIPTTTNGVYFDVWTSKTPLGTIFAGKTRNWWTGLRIRPHYPVQP
ncbi:hypothetical protein AB4Y64_07830 [Lysobacter sp. TAF61]|uniref:hypothetical protein n=1 Tax=Lysobacter sp. TAF61 TaxID=3233072 RepID=UPI003F99535E